MALFGRPLRDHLPHHRPNLRREWRQIADSREVALAKRHLMPGTTIENGRELRPLKIADSVQIQNQTGNHPKKWHNTGIISETLPHRQYRVIVDGSRRVTLRNRRFLRKIDPVCRRTVPTTNPAEPRPSTHSQPPVLTTHTVQPVTTFPEPSGQLPSPQLPLPSSPPRQTRPTPSVPSTPYHTPNLSTREGVPRRVLQDDDQCIRRSTRERRPPIPLSPKMKGQSYD